jgi:glutamate-1-semialdehyde 2,1-aminomutase
VTGTNSIFMTHFTDSAIKDAADVATSNKQLLAKYHMALMAEHGIFFLPTKMGAFSYAHDESDVKKLLAATESIAGSGLLKQ